MRISSLVSLNRKVDLKVLANQVVPEGLPGTEIYVNDADALKYLKIVKTEASAQGNVGDMRSEYTFFDRTKAEKKVRGQQKLIQKEAWTDLNVTIIMELDKKDKTMDLWMFVNDVSLMTYSNLLALFLKDLRGLRESGWTSKWNTYDKRAEFGMEIFMYSVDDMVEFDTKILYGEMDFKAMLTATVSHRGRDLVADFKIFKKEYMVLKSELKLLMDKAPDGKDYWEPLSNGTLALKELEKFFLEMGWINRNHIFKEDKDKNKVKRYGPQYVAEALDNTVETQDDDETLAIESLIMASGGDATDLSFEVNMFTIFDDVQEQEDPEEDDQLVGEINLDLGMLDSFGDTVFIMSRYTDTAQGAADDMHLNLRKVMDMLVKRVVHSKYRRSRKGVERAMSYQGNRLASAVFNHIRYVTRVDKLTDQFMELIMFSVLSQVKAEVRVEMSFTVKLVNQNMVKEDLDKGGLLTFEERREQDRQVAGPSIY
jgi:hypothetical protein